MLCRERSKRPTMAANWGSNPTDNDDFLHAFPSFSDPVATILETSHDQVQGGHAVVAIGYDDNRKIGKDKGAIKIRNSWGTQWGQNGYGWLPYSYIEAGLAEDFWSLFKNEYVKLDIFE